MRTKISRSFMSSIALAAAGLMLAACGSDDDGAGTAEESASADGGMLSAYLTCIDEQGIDLPDDWAEGMSGFDPGSLPSGMPTDMPSDMPTDMPTDMAGGFGGGGFEAPEGVSDEDWQAAQEACADELPAGGGFPGGGGEGTDDLTAYRDCLSQRGVEFGDDLAALDDTDPETAAAMEECAVLAPETATDSES
ncbi:hypothetical protein [Glycomyces sp. NPDC047010]|uniref:hypothetical protein n=1 Tax=Glycomyces sp. NPDC047010 TaxID=3155023 RepID=UPI0033D9FBC2